MADDDDTTLPCQEGETNSFVNLYDIAHDRYCQQNEAWLCSLRCCADSLYEQITANDVELKQHILKPSRQNKVAVWSSSVPRMTWKGHCFQVRTLLKGPDAGCVFGYPWLTRKGVEPVLARLKKRYEPFDVHFTQHNGDKNVVIFVSWP